MKKFWEKLGKVDFLNVWFLAFLVGSWIANAKGNKQLGTDLLATGLLAKVFSLQNALDRISMSSKWFVWNPAGNVPRFEHTSQQSAVKEAVRLAGHNPGQEFHILKSVGECVQSSQVSIHIHESNLPF